MVEGHLSNGILEVGALRIRLETWDDIYAHDSDLREEWRRRARRTWPLAGWGLKFGEEVAFVLRVDAYTEWWRMHRVVKEATRVFERIEVEIDGASAPIRVHGGARSVQALDAIGVPGCRDVWGGERKMVVTVTADEWLVYETMEKARPRLLGVVSYRDDREAALEGLAALAKVYIDTAPAGSPLTDAYINAVPYTMPARALIDVVEGLRRVEDGDRLFPEVAVTVPGL